VLDLLHRTRLLEEPSVLDQSTCDPLTSTARDSVDALDTDEPPTIVSISDIHGHLTEARSALLTLSDHPDYAPLVEADAARRLNWVGGDEYVLVFNGDLIDRGPHSEDVVEMAQRLTEQAPPGHVRVTVGNHEMALLTPALYQWDMWYSGQRTRGERERFLQAIVDGHVTAAYSGYNFTYAHAGQTHRYDAGAVNESLVTAASDLLEVVGTEEDEDVQNAVTDAYPTVFGFDGETGRGPDAGIAWLDFEHMPGDAPAQIVGHTIQEYPVRRGNVICENVIRKNRPTDGGEAVLLETPDSLVALGRGEDESVIEHEFSLPAE
jgi:hypothetical protein